MDKWQKASTGGLVLMAAAIAAYSAFGPSTPPKQTEPEKKPAPLIEKPKSTFRDEPLSLTTATAEEFDTLPYISPQTAENMVEYREHHGGVLRITDLPSIKGIGKFRYSQIKDLVKP